MLEANFMPTEIPEAPEWLLRPPLANNDNAMGSSPIASSTAAQDIPNAREIAYGASALSMECACVRNAAQGTRNDTLNRAAFSVAQLVHAGAISEAHARAELQQAALDCGLTASEVRATLNGAFRDGVASPRNLSALSERQAAVPSANAALIAPTEIHWDDASAGAARRVEYLVKGLFGKTGVSLVAGQAGAGKSAVVLDLAVATVFGGEWFSHKIKATGGTLWLAGEAIGLMGSRLDAVRTAKLAGQQHFHPETGEEIDINKLPIAWAGATNLADHRQFEAASSLAMRVKAEMQEAHGVELRLIVIDSVVSAFGFAEDPDAAKASAAMKAMSKLSEDTGALVIAIHHYGKTADAGVYGTYSWTAMSDSILAVLADKDPLGNVRSRQIALKRTKTGSEEGWSAGFTLRAVTLGVDEDSDDVTAPMIEHAALMPREIRIPRGPKLSNAGKCYCNALARIIAEHGQSVPPYGAEGPTVRAVDREKIRAEFHLQWPADGDTPAKKQEAKRKAFDRGEVNAVNKERVQVRDHGAVVWVWPFDNDATLADSVERRG
ncbi:RecA-family ATPase [Rhodoblastus acidophilus]|uniref:AAA family ATPase n=1 Tax=Rhodoblastus acidophilus TaxID=1074 RepID=UPI0022257938|nr:AAA family ATPase [Rhodoblastus acidophilus]MCW2314887.1 RecA-family ATPase [Rhodoblastus acidophilus]